MPFVTINKEAVVSYWRDFDDRTPIRKAPRMPVTKSVSEVAWAAVYALAREMVAGGKAPDVDSAVQQLRLGNHPVYATYLAASVPGAPTPTTPASDIGKVLKAAEPAAVAKRRQVMAEVSKRAGALVRSGLSQAEAMREVFKRDPAIYEAHRQASYASGPVAPAAAPASTVAPPGPALALAKRLAVDLRDSDPWGAHAGASEQELVEKVFRDHPALFQAYRQESYQRS